MQKSLQLSALIACALLSGCSNDSTTILQAEIAQKEIVEQSVEIETGEALLEPQTLTGNFDTLIQLGKKPSAESVDYYTVKETTLADQSKKLVITALFLNISESSAQDFFKRTNNVSEVVIIAETVMISTEVKFPGANVFITADELSFVREGKIITTPKIDPLFPGYGANGNAGKNGGDIVLNVKKLNLGEGQIRFELNGGKGQAAGLGKEGASGVSISPLYGNVIKECTTVTTSCYEPEIGEMAETPVTTCRGSDRLPTNGLDATAPGLPGIGGNGGTLYLSHSSDEPKISYAIENKPGRLGDTAPLVKGGALGTPQSAVLRNITTHNSRGRCKTSGGGGKPSARTTTSISNDQVLATTSKGRDYASQLVTNTAKVGSILDIRANSLAENENLILTGDMRRIRLEYAKDLYRNNFFTEARETLNKIGESKSTVLDELLVTDEMNSLMNQLNSNKDFYGYDLNLAPVISLEATMNIYKQNVRTSMNTIAMVAGVQNSVLSAREKMDKLIVQKNQLSNQMEIAYKNHETAYLMIPNLEIKLVGLDHSRQSLEESLQKVEAEITAEANRNIHSAEKKKKILGGLKLIATLASVSPLGAPAAQFIGSSLNTIIDFSQKKDMDWQSTLKEGYGIYKDLKKVDWHASHDDWNKVYSSLDKEVFLSTNKIEKKRTLAYLTHLHQTTKPLTDEIKKYYDNTLSKKVPAGQYEAEIERIKSIHPLFKELVGKLNDVQQKKAELENLLSQVNNSLITSKSEIIRDFSMITSLETQEEDFVEGLNFSLGEILTKIDKDARNRLLKYKGALIKAYQYRTLMPFPGDLDLENINRSIKNFANKGERNPPVDDLIQVYEEDIAVMGESLFNYVQSGKFKEYDNEYTMDLNDNELKALALGKAVYLDLTKELELFSNKENVRIISIEMDSFNASNVTVKNADFIVTHLGTSILTKNRQDYLFNHLNESNPATWISRLDLRSNSSVLLKESSSNASLLMSILDRDSREGTLLFNRVGAKGVFALKLNAQDAVLNQGTLKINYTYSLY